jgi:hypothetical protein
MALTVAMQGALVETSCLSAIRDHMSKSATYPHKFQDLFRPCLLKLQERLLNLTACRVLGPTMLRSGDGMGCATSESADRNADAHELTASIGRHEGQYAEPKHIWFVRSGLQHAVAGDGWTL